MPGVEIQLHVMDTRKGQMGAFHRYDPGIRLRPPTPPARHRVSRMRWANGKACGFLEAAVHSGFENPKADRQRLSLYLGSRMVTPKARSDRDRRASPP